jgi:hypothetical protein
MFTPAFTDPSGRFQVDLDEAFSRAKNLAGVASGAS